MADLSLLRKLEGLQTAETAAATLGITRQSALNLLSRLKKEGHVSSTGGGPQKRLYRITTTIQQKRSPGMFDIINTYAPRKLLAPYDHQVHGRYGVEDALVDAALTGNARIMRASMSLFCHITNWQKLHRIAEEKKAWNKVRALYELAKLHMRVRRMPARYRQENSAAKEKHGRATLPFTAQDFARAA